MQSETLLQRLLTELVLAAGEHHIGKVGGEIRVASAELTRPNDAAPYIAKDAVADSTSAPSPTLLRFADLARVAGGSGYIVRARMFTDQAAFVTRLRLHLYSQPLSAAFNDNAAFTLNFSNRTMRIGHIDFSVGNTEGAGSTGSNAWAVPGDGVLPIAFACDPSTTHLWGLLETLDAFTPAANQKFYIQLFADAN